MNSQYEQAEATPRPTRRAAMWTGAALAGAAVLRHGGIAAAQQAPATRPNDVTSSPDAAAQPPGEPGRDYTPVVVPDGGTLPYKLVDGVKAFHLVANAFKREFAPGLVVDCWGWNGQSPGPVIEAVEGD